MEFEFGPVWEWWECVREEGFLNASGSSYFAFERLSGGRFAFKVLGVLAEVVAEFVERYGEFAGFAGAPFGDFDGEVAMAHGGDSMPEFGYRLGDGSCQP